MIKKILTIILITTGLQSPGQNNNPSAKSPSFKDIIIQNENIIAVNDSGQVIIWDLSSYERIFESTDTNLFFTTVSVDQNGILYAGTDRGQLYTLNSKTGAIEPFMKLKKEFFINKIIFNSANEIFLIVPYAVYDPIKDKHWSKFKHYNNQLIVRKRFLHFFLKRTDVYFNMPGYTYIDSDDVIWMSSAFGEFGGSIQRFDTKNRKIINQSIDSLNYTLLFPRSIFEDENKNIYITSGLQHFINSGEIFKICDNTAYSIYNYDRFKDISQKSTVDSNGVVNIIAKRNDGLFIGPGAFNKNDKKIYFASSKGFFRCNIPLQGEIQEQEFLFQPELIMENEPLAIGVSMAVKKILFTNDNRLIFLSYGNGIGIFDGKNTIFLQ